MANKSSPRLLHQRLGVPPVVPAAPRGVPILQVLTFIIPFQLSPVETRKRVRKAIPKFLKVACRPKPSQGCVSSHSGGRRERGGTMSVSRSLWLSTPASSTAPKPQLTQVSKELHAQSCKDEKQQHEEKSQVPHLEKRKRHGKDAAGSPASFPEAPPLLPTPPPSYLGQGLHHRVQQCPHAHSHLQQLQNCRTGQCCELAPPGPPSRSWESQAGLELVGWLTHIPAHSCWASL